MLQLLNSELFAEKNIEVWVLRLDKIHADYGGNKILTLKYHIEEALQNDCKTIASFGGPYSNHLAALAAYGKSHQLKTIGYVRFQGDYKKYPTLVAAEKNGMQLQFLTNNEFKIAQQKIINQPIDLQNKIYCIPAGGHTQLGIKGCKEILALDILKKSRDNFTHIFVPVGYGTTLAGIANSASTAQKIFGITAIKNGEELNEEIKSITTKKNWQLLTNYHFDGFGKINQSLIDFMTKCKVDFDLETDRVYTSKMLFAIFDLATKNFFNSNDKILAIHTGGLQGNN